VKRNSGLIAGLVVVLTAFGVSNLQKNGSESPSATESKESTLPSAKPVPGSNNQAYSPCTEIAQRLRRFVRNNPVAPNGKRNTDPAAIEEWDLPDSCYEHKPSSVLTPVQTLHDVNYSYDASWFPWDATNKDYTFLADQLKAEDLRGIRQAQPGVMVFRRALA